jgi:OOP family OmpA-OmpF porin
MTRQLWACTLVAALALQAGCAAIQRPTWNKPVGKGTFIPAALCAMAGAGAGAGIADAQAGQSCVEVNGVRQCDNASPDYWQGALIGAAVGAVVCGVAGHLFLDAEPQPAAPPPPPPPPAAAVEPPAPPPVVKKRIVLRGVTFDFNQAEIRGDSRPVLDEAVSTLQANPGVNIVAAGYTDAIGSDDYNQALSVRRAEAVYRYLVNHGVAPERLQVVGYGKTHPVADNATESGRAQNRRVELQVQP